MKLFLDHTARLNLHALMGAQRVSLDDLRMFWKLQDMIDLTEEERAVIKYRVVPQNGADMVQWDIKQRLPVREYEFTEAESSRLARMMKEWQPGFLIGADRVWVEPLMAQLDGAADRQEQRAQPPSGAGLGMAMPRGGLPAGR